MKIIQLVLGKANPDRMNGINRIVHELAHAMHADSLDVELWGITADPDAPTPERSYPMRLFPSGKSKWNPGPELTTALDELDEESVVHLHGGLLPKFSRIAKQLRRRKIRYVITPHGSYSNAALGRNGLLKRLYISLIDRRVLESANAVQVNSEQEAEELRALAPRATVRVVHNGQTLNSRQSGSREELFTLAYCGRLDIRHKGLDLLLEGFALFLERGGHGRLELIGDGDDRARLEQLANSSGDAVEFLGAMFAEAKLERLASAHAFIHSSRHEGMPMAVLEAASLGLPLIVSPGTNLSEPVEAWKAGFVLDPNTPENIAEVLLQVAEQHAAGELSVCGSQARAMIAAEFSWNDVARKLVRDAYSCTSPAPALAEAA